MFNQNRQHGAAETAKITTVVKTSLVIHHHYHLTYRHRFCDECTCVFSRDLHRVSTSIRSFIIIIPMILYSPDNRPNAALKKPSEKINICIRV